LVRVDEVWRAAVACWHCYWQAGAGKTATAAQWDALYPDVYADQLPLVVSELLSAETRDPASYPWPLPDVSSSTKIFRLRIGEDAEGIVFADPKFGLDLFRTLQMSTPIGKRWVPPRIVIDRDDYHGRRLTKTDFPASITAPSLSRRAADGLRELLATCGELLPTVCDEGEYFLVNVTAVCDILDEQRSRIHRVAGRVLDIHRHVFKANAALEPGTVMFKLPCRPSGRAVYVTDAFVDRVRELGLVGLQVDLVGAIG
jgi:hypothetical protein